MQHFGGFWLTVLLQFSALTLAAPSTIPIKSTNGLDLLSNFSSLTSPSLSTLPPDPYQIRVYNTPTSLILYNYGSALQRIEVLDILLQGQSAVIDGLVASNGNAPIERLAFTFWSGELYMKIQPGRGGRMKWLMLAQTLQGILQFMEGYGWMAVKFTVLDDEAGPVGVGTLVYYRRPGGVEVDGSSLVGTS